MNLFLTVVFCALYFLAATEAYVICGTGELEDTQCTYLMECQPIINRIKELKSRRINELLAYKNEVFKLRCYSDTNKYKEMSVCCPVKRSTEICGRQLDNKVYFTDGLTEAYDYEWLALLEYRTPSGIEVHCSGVLISDRHILTAASCLHRDYDLTSVRLGEYNLATEIDFIDDDDPMPKSTSIGISSTKIHEKFSYLYGAYGSFTSEKHDIAILRLARSVSSQPICLTSQDVRVDKDFIVAGWGSSPYDNGLKFQAKSAVQMKTCKCADGDAESIVCAKPRSKNYACVGDVGAPLMHRERIGDEILFTIAGIYAPDSSSPCEDEIKTYTNVYKYRDWIAKNMH